MTARDLPDWINSISKAAPSIVAAGVLVLLGLMVRTNSALESLPEMRKTLQMVCDQLAEKKAIDAVQNSRIDGLVEENKALQQELRRLMMR